MAMRCVTLLLVSSRDCGSDDGAEKKKLIFSQPDGDAGGETGASSFHHECLQLRVAEDELLGQFRFRAIGHSEAAGKRGGGRRPSTVARGSVLVNATSGRVLETSSDGVRVREAIAQGDVVVCFVLSSGGLAYDAAPTALQLRSYISMAGPLFKVTQHGRFFNLNRRWHKRLFMLRDMWIHKVHRWNDGDDTSPRKYSGLAKVSPHKSSRLITPRKGTQNSPSPIRVAGSVELDAYLLRARIKVLDTPGVRQISAYRAPANSVGGFTLTFPKDMAGGGLQRDGDFGRELHLCSDDEETFQLWKKAITFVISEESKANEVAQQLREALKLGQKPAVAMVNKPPSLKDAMTSPRHISVKGASAQTSQTENDSKKEHEFALQQLKNALKEAEENVNSVQRDADGKLSHAEKELQQTMETLKVAQNSLQTEQLKNKCHREGIVALKQSLEDQDARLAAEFATVKSLKRKLKACERQISDLLAACSEDSVKTAALESKLRDATSRDDGALSKRNENWSPSRSLIIALLCIIVAFWYMCSLQVIVRVYYDGTVAVDDH